MYLFIMAMYSVHLLKQFTFWNRLKAAIKEINCWFSLSRNEKIMLFIE